MSHKKKTVGTRSDRKQLESSYKTLKHAKEVQIKRRKWKEKWQGCGLSSPVVNGHVFLKAEASCD